MAENESMHGAHAQPSRRLAAIMFTDLVGYSQMAHRDEALAIELLEQHRGWVRTILPRYGGREIETIGDAFLVEFAGALAAVECAVALQHRFGEYNKFAPYNRRMQLRIGIHLGEVEHKDDKVMGDAVNVASRIHGMADPGGICVSEDVQRAVRNRGGMRFKSMGTKQLKNIDEPHELFKVFAGPKAGQSAFFAGLRQRFGLPRWLVITVSIIVLINLLDSKNEPPGVPPERDSDSDTPAIAVLPFENLSAEPDSAFFTDGLHDTVIGHLSRVAGLKVISRTSVMGYRGKQKNLKRIARELGADHILEGSVQRSGKRLRVAAQLIDTETDTHVWSHEYDREIKDVFEVQADIAQNVANAVHAKLTPEDKQDMAEAPTANQEAYDLYLRAVLVDRSAEPDPKKTQQAIGWLETAVRLDPNFARAYALLASLHDSLAWSGFDPGPERRAKVSENADRALALEPGLAEAHIAKAMDLYHGSRNYDAALAELEIARGIEPGNAKVHYWLGPIYRRQGSWDDALESLETATELDPLNAAYLSEYAGTLQMLHRYPEAGEAFERVRNLEPNSPFGPVILAFNTFLLNGDLGPIREVLAKIPPGVDPACQVSQLRSGLALIERRYDDALAQAQACKDEYLGNSGGEQVPREFPIALTRWLISGRKTPPEAAGLRAKLEKMLAARPDQPNVRMNLAMTYVMLGDRKRALQECDRALEQMPLKRDALTGADLLRKAAELHANAGEESRALDELEQVMKLPNGGHTNAIKLDPAFDLIRQDPRFQKLVADNLPKQKKGILPANFNPMDVPGDVGDVAADEDGS